jgi:HTH-type transcriptional regulator / antitoxin HigA
MIGVNTNINSRQYGRLLSKALPTIIRTEEENERALLLVEKLFAKGDDLTFEENALLELLVKLIADFEEEYYPIRDASPQEVLVEIMSARGLKQKDLTEVFGSKSRASEAISGKREISKSQAKALAGFFNVSVELFI